MESTNKNRLLFLLRYLYENTNDDNKVSTSQLLDIIQQNGIKVSRNTLSNDIKTITDAGFDIISGNGPSNENLYHWGSRTFDLPELKLLIDAVSSARFINEKMSTRLIEKLASLASLHDKTPLKARIYTADRIKADNRQIYYIMETINKAIDSGRKIAFCYCDIDINLQLVERNNGEPYVNSPYALIWNDDWYYLLGYSDSRKKIVTFRVDRMRMPEILEEEAVPAPEGFSAADFANKAFMMFDGEEEMVTLECETGLVKKLADKFGDHFEVEEIGDDRIPLDAQKIVRLAEILILRLVFCRAACYHAFNGTKRSIKERRVSHEAYEPGTDGKDQTVCRAVLSGTVQEAPYQ